MAYRRSPTGLLHLRQGLLCIIILLSCFLLFSGFSNLRSYLLLPSTLPIHELELTTDAHYVSLDKLKKWLIVKVNGGFFSVDLKGLRKSLLQLGWVRSVWIRRIFPSKLSITLYGYQPVAYWMNSGLLSASGIVFKPESPLLPLKLPHLSGPIDSGSLVLQYFTQFKAMVASKDLSIRSLDLSNRLACSLVLNNGMRLVLGRDEVAQHLARFLILYDSVFEKSTRHAVLVDMRYSNGMAVRWSK